MKKLAVLFCLMVFAVTAAAQEPAAAPRDPAINVPYASAFVFTTGSTANDYDLIDHRALNANSKAVLFTTHLYGAGASAISMLHQHGVRYDTAAGKWAVVAQNQSTIAPNLLLNVQMQGLGGNVLRHVSTSSSVNTNSTYIDSPLTNGKPNAILFVTIDQTPNGIYHNVPVGVWYDSESQKWAIFNENTTPMPVGVAFNVQVLENNLLTFQHTSTVANASSFGSHITVIDHPALNNNSNAIIILSQVWNPGGVGGVFNNSYVGLWYDTGINRWTIFNEVGSTIPTNATFNVHLVGLRTGSLLTANGSFEAPGTEAKTQAAAWTAVGSALRKCNKYNPVKVVSYSGECMVQMLPGSSLSQTTDFAGILSLIEFNARMKSPSIPASAVKLTIKVTYTNGEKRKTKASPSALGTEYAFTSLSALTEFTETHKIKVSVAVNSTATGKLLVDDLYAVYTAAVRPVPPADEMVTAPPAAR